jgi:hypothetical protein
VRDSLIVVNPTIFTFDNRVLTPCEAMTAAPLAIIFADCRREAPIAVCAKFLIFAQGAVEPSYRHGTFVGLGLIAVVLANARRDYDISCAWAGY